MSHNFLVVRKKTYVDQQFVAAVAKVPATDDQPAIPAVKEVPLIEHDEVVQCFLETDHAAVAKHLADPDKLPGFTYYAIVFDDDLNPSFRTVREKGRKKAPAKEILTIEDDDGNEIGSTEI